MWIWPTCRCRLVIVVGAERDHGLAGMDAGVLVGADGSQQPQTVCGRSRSPRISTSIACSDSRATVAMTLSAS
jgi:hypothetical protein